MITKIIDRHGKDAIAVDGLGKNPGFAQEPPKDGFDVIPMWVADMNFETVPTIPKAIMDMAAHPAYGYFSPVEEYYDSIIRWHKIRNNVEGLMPEYIGYENGVLGGVISALTAFAAPGSHQIRLLAVPVQIPDSFQVRLLQSHLFHACL